MLPENILYYGRELPLPKRIPLRAGPLTLFFQNGDIRHIRCGRREIVRRVYLAVRDRNWGTLAASISNLEISQDEHEFLIRFDVTCQDDQIDFRWRAEIGGLADGTINFSIDGQAYSDFWRNRIGFCLLHPITECAGQPCEVERIDGSRVLGQFPLFISPHQPFKELRAIIHEVAPGLSAEVRMQGDTFEMEDQRNWTDASFKTYSTPLDLTFPVLVKKGEQVRQSVQVKIEGLWDKGCDTGKPTQETSISLSPDPSKILPAFPTLGLGLASHGQALTPREIARLRALNLAHLRVDLWMSDDSWRSDLQRGANESRALDCALEIALHLTEYPETALSNLLNEMVKIRPIVARWIIFHVDESATKSKWVALACKILGDYDRAAPFGCGADSNFTELNRNPPDPQIADFLAYAANPQVHAFDNLSLIENMAGFGETVISARRLAAGKPIIVSPVTLKARFNAAATGEENQPESDQLPAPVDPRQMSLFGAGWTLGSIKYLAENGVSSVTFYETTGWLGLMETETGSPLPAQFQSIAGAVFSLYHVFANLAAFAGGQVIATNSSHPLKVESLALRKGDQTRVLIANLESRPYQILLADLPEHVQVKTLDETNALEAIQSPKRFQQQPGEIVNTKEGCLTLKMKPFAIMRIDVKGV